METTEKIVEAYVRYVKGWATIPNIRCDGQQEIDLLAIDPKPEADKTARFHIETSISISQSFSKLNAKPFDAQRKKLRGQQAPMRRTLGYFLHSKFALGPDGQGSEAVEKKLREYGFENGNYGRVIVTWDWTEEAELQAEDAGVFLWDFRKIMQEIAQEIRDKSSYFSDDTLRTISLFVRGMPGESRSKMTADIPEIAEKRPSADSPAFWLYQNWTHKRARLHRADCSYCNHGRGTQNSTDSKNGKWEKFSSEDEGRTALRSLNYANAKACAACF